MLLLDNCPGIVACRWQKVQVLLARDTDYMRMPARWQSLACQGPQNLLLDHCGQTLLPVPGKNHSHMCVLFWFICVAGVVARDRLQRLAHSSSNQVCSPWQAGYFHVLVLQRVWLVPLARSAVLAAVCTEWGACDCMLAL